MEKIKKTELDLTTGNLFAKMIRFAFPFMMTTIFQLLYTTIDLWTVSTYGGGSLSMSAIGCNNPLINLVITFLINIAIGSNVCGSIAKGKNDAEKGKKVVYTSLCISVIGGILFGLFGYIFARPLLVWMDTPASIIDKATDYLKIYFIGVPFLSIYNYGSQLLRSFGDSKRPFIFLMISGIINVIFDLLFVIVFKLDVKGVAIATVISEVVSATLVFIWFRVNDNGFIKFRFKEIRIYKKELIEILKIGVPSGFQGLAFCLPNVLIQSSLYTITNYSINGIAISQDEIVAGASASSQIESYIFAMLDAFAVATVSFVGQNMGAKNIKNIKKSFWYAILWMFIFMGACSVIIGIFPFPLLSIFIKDSEGINVTNALLAGRQRLFILGFTYALDGIMDICGSYLKGMRKSGVPAVITIIGCTGTRILFLYTLFKMDYFHTIIWLYSAFPISWILVNIVYIPVVLTVEKKIFQQMKTPIEKDFASLDV